MGKTKKTIPAKAAQADTVKVKASHQVLFEYLIENQSRIDAEVHQELLGFCYGKARPVSAILTRSHEPVALVCYYYKRWMPLTGSSAVAFPSNSSGPYGRNRCCSKGNKLYGKQLAVYNKVKASIEAELRDGVETLQKPITDSERKKLAERRSELKLMLEDAFEVKSTIEETDLGFETLEELIDYLDREGIDYVPPRSGTE